MPTKLITRPTPNFTDSLISSIGALYLTMFSFALIYSYIGATRYWQSQTAPELVALDRLLVLRDLSRGTHPYIRDAKIKDLPDFFFGAMRDKSDEVIDEAIKEDEREDAPQQKQSDKSEKTPSKFTEELLQNSELIRDVPMRMSVGGTCNVLVTRLLPGHTFNIATFVVVSKHPLWAAGCSVALGARIIGAKGWRVR